VQFWICRRKIRIRRREEKVRSVVRGSLTSAVIRVNTARRNRASVAERSCALTCQWFSSVVLMSDFFVFCANLHAVSATSGFFFSNSSVLILILIFPQVPLFLCVEGLALGCGAARLWTLWWTGSGCRQPKMPLHGAKTQPKQFGKHILLPNIGIYILDAHALKSAGSRRCNRIRDCGRQWG
jgi:hypothetical protein